MKINNKIFGYFLNKFDFPIRFLYCRFPMISKLIFWNLYASNLEKIDALFEKTRAKLPKKYFHNKVCLELGPGNSYINAYNFLQYGAQKVILVDKFPRYIKTMKQKKFAQDELNYIRKKFNNKPDLNNITLCVNDLSEISLPEKVDFIYSKSVLEHLNDIESNIKKMSEIIKTGRLMYHVINFMDHFNFNEPWLFYKYSDETWNKWLTKLGISYTNRVRYDDMIRLFIENGFSILNEEIITESLGPKIKIHNQFKQKDKNILEIGVAHLLLEKNG